MQIVATPEKDVCNKTRIQVITYKQQLHLNMIKIRPIYWWLIGISMVIIIALIVFYMLFFTAFSTKNDTYYIYIDTDDTIDSVYTKLSPASSGAQMMGFDILAQRNNYAQKIKTGRYGIPTDKNTREVFRILQLGMQTPINITIPSVRTIEQLATRLDKQLMLDSCSIATAFNDNDFCKEIGYDTTSIAAFILPNTYEVYWDMSLDALVKRMQREHNAFWEGKRMERAKEMGMTVNEVVTLASIVDWETAYDPEMPDIAGLYLNRLRIGMKLQADPTVVFANRQLGIRRVLNVHLSIDSPYNTYLYKGLPPGPIMIPSTTAIDAVLYHKKNDYLFMCANSDFSGTHKFAKNFAEHKKNARAYSKALDQRGIN